MNDKKIRSLNRLLNSRAYKKASNLVAGIIESPEHTSRLIEKVNAKLGKNKSGRLHALLDSVSVCFRLLQAYVSGEYRDISLESLTLLVASLIYFVMPFDVMPDFILGFGLFDDAALIAWTVRALASELARFTFWEKSLKTNKTEANPTQ